MSTAVICDVSPREEPHPIAGAASPRSRINLLRALHAAGLRRVDVGTFAPAEVVASAPDEVRVPAPNGTSAGAVDGPDVDVPRTPIALLDAARDLPGLECTALVSDRGGLTRALRAGAGRVRFGLAVTHSQSRATHGRGREDVLADLAVQLRDAAAAGARVRVDLDCAFDCPFEGVVPEADALDWVERVLALEPGVEIGLVDTTGNAAPDQVARVFRHALDSWGTRFAFAARDTYGMGAASVASAWGQGCRVFDAAAGGIGGAPGVSGLAGNVATEDLAWLFRRMGVDTGLDLDALLAAADLAAGVLGAVASGRLRGVAAARRTAA